MYTYLNICVYIIYIIHVNIYIFIQCCSPLRCFQSANLLTNPHHMYIYYIHHRRRRSEFKLLRLPTIQYIFTGIPVTFKQVFTGVPKNSNRFSLKRTGVP